MFDFNASLNDVAPASLMKLPVDSIKNGKREDCLWMSFMCCFFYLYNQG